MTQLTEHFTLEEFTYSDTANACGIDNTPGELEQANLQRVAEVLEKIRDLCDECPITITSGYRCQSLNEQVGGVPDSAHCQGLAADIIIPEFGEPVEVCNEILPHLYEFGIDQLINESNSYGQKWVHIGLSEGEARCEAFTVSEGGTQTGIV